VRDTDTSSSCYFNSLVGLFLCFLRRNLHGVYGKLLYFNSLVGLFLCFGMRRIRICVSSIMIYFNSLVGLFLCFMAMLVICQIVFRSGTHFNSLVGLFLCFQRETHCSRYTPMLGLPSFQFPSGIISLFLACSIRSWSAKFL